MLFLLALVRSTHFGVLLVAGFGVYLPQVLVMTFWLTGSSIVARTLLLNTKPLWACRKGYRPIVVALLMTPAYKLPCSAAKYKNSLVQRYARWCVVAVFVATFETRFFVSFLIVFVSFSGLLRLAALPLVALLSQLLQRLAPALLAQTTTVFSCSTSWYSREWSGPYWSLDLRLFICRRCSFALIPPRAPVDEGRRPPRRSS